MFDQLKSMGALTKLLQNREGMKDAMERVKAKMERSHFMGQAGGGACRVTTTGQMKVLSVDLSAALVSGMAADEKTRELAGSLIAEATNDSIKQAQEALQAEIQREAKAMGLGDFAAGLGGSGLGGLLG